MDDENLPPSLAATISLYKPRVSTVVVPPAAMTPILASESRRWYVRFEWDKAGAVGVLLLPSTGQNIGVFPAVSSSESVFKWRDCPASVAGDWYCFAPGGVTLLIHEEIYVGG